MPENDDGDEYGALLLLPYGAINVWSIENAERFDMNSGQSRGW